MAELQDGGPQRRPASVFRRATLWLVVWIVGGLGIMAWGFQMDDQLWGSTLFFVGAALANAGVIGTLLWAYRNRGE